MHNKATVMIEMFAKKRYYFGIKSFTKSKVAGYIMACGYFIEFMIFFVKKQLKSYIISFQV